MDQRVALSQSSSVQVHHLRGIRVVDLFGRLTARVCRAARLAFAAGRLQVVVLIRQGLHIRFTIAQRGHRGNSSGEDAHGVERAFEWELVVRNLVRVATPTTRLDADQVPAGSPVLVRLRHLEVVLSLVAPEHFLRLVRVCHFASGYSQHLGAEEHQQEE